MANSQIRNTLFDITEEYVNDRFSGQISVIGKLKEYHSLNIELRDEIKVDDPITNCYAFAFDLCDSIIEKQFSFKIKRFLPNSNFCKTLIDNFLVECLPNEILDGSYAIYFNTELPVHAGKSYNSQILSKWGSGHIWLHDKFTVPKSFGDIIKFYKSVEKDELIKLYKDWVMSQIPDK